MVVDVLVGRQNEVGRLRRFVRDVSAGRGRAVLVEGEPGIGKSALLAAGLADASSAGCRVLWGNADRRSAGFPLRVLVGCFDAVPAVEISDGDEELRFAGSPVPMAMERVLALVDQLCAESPLVLVVDDLQWADELSLAVWAQLSLVAGQLPLLLVGACRPVPQRRELMRVRRSLGTRDAALISLGPLPPAATRELVHASLSARVAPRLMTMADRAGGNPRYVKELVDALRRERRLVTGKGVPVDLVDDDREPRLPRSLVAAIEERLGFLAAPTVRVIQRAALLGTRFSVTDVAVLTVMRPTELVTALDEARLAGVVVESSACLTFRHPLIQQALYEAIPPVSRSVLHRQAAESLAVAGSPAEVVAGQLLVAPESMDSWVLDWVAEAGPALVSRSPTVAAELFRRALEQVAIDDPRCERLEGQLASVLRTLARYDEVARFARAVLARDIGGTHRLRMAWTLAQSLLFSRPQKAAEIARATLDDDHGGDDGAPWVARLHGLYACALAIGGGDVDAAAQEAMAAGERTGDRPTIGYALLARAFADERTNVARSLELADRALTTIGDHPETTDIQQVLLANRVRYRAGFGRRAEAGSELNRARHSSMERLPGIQVFVAEHHTAMGRWDDAVAELKSIETIPESYVAVLAHGLWALIAGHRDDRTRATEHLDALRQVTIGSGVALVTDLPLLLARALVAEQDGRLADALAAFTPLLDADRPAETSWRYRWMVELVRLALAAGDRTIARYAMNIVTADAKSEPLPARDAAVGCCRGLVCDDPVPLLAAADFYRRAGTPLELGNCLENAAVVLGRRDDVSRARVAFNEAVRMYQQLGAAWDAKRAESRLREYGIRWGRRRIRRRATTGWQALTPTERRVAYLVADGRSNPDVAAQLYLSRRTVQTHVSNILRKLGVRSRVEIRREVRRHGVTSLQMPGSQPN